MTIDESITQTYSKYGLKQIGSFHKYYGIGESNPVYNIGGEYVMFEKVNNCQYVVHPAYKQVFEKVFENEK